jgi:hypothetical protein
LIFFPNPLGIFHEWRSQPIEFVHSLGYDLCVVRTDRLPLSRQTAPPELIQDSGTRALQTKLKFINRWTDNIVTDLCFHDQASQHNIQDSSLENAIVPLYPRDMFLTFWTPLDLESHISEFNAPDELSAFIADVCTVYLQPAVQKAHSVEMLTRQDDYGIFV